MELLLRFYYHIPFNQILQNYCFITRTLTMNYKRLMSATSISKISRFEIQFNSSIGFIWVITFWILYCSSTEIKVSKLKSNSQWLYNLLLNSEDIESKIFKVLKIENLKYESRVFGLEFKNFETQRLGIKPLVTSQFTICNSNKNII